jgi:AraC-like DNA-binding protein
MFEYKGVNGLTNIYFPWRAEKDELIKVEEFNNNTPVISHKHEYIEIVLITRGSCIHRYHNTEVTLIPGDVFIVVPHEEHSYAINSDVTIFNCQFYPDALGEDWRELKEISGIYDMLMVEPLYRTEINRQEILHLQPAEISYIESILIKMIEEEKKQVGYHLAQKAYLILLLCVLGRVWEKQFKSSSHEYNKKREMLAEALRYLESNIINELNVSELALKACMSPHYFRKVFKEVTGLAPIEYINKIRINKAVQLLKDGSLTISEVAEMVGINDTNYFSRLFRKNMYCTPTEFRKKNNLC